MKIKRVKIAGFRGFNKKQELLFDDKLTIIYGPNSYGKTSISEALEWLLFGITSKVEVSASGKNEFKGTYRNIHYPSDSTPFVESLIEQDNGESVSIRGELGDDDSITRFINDEIVDKWPWETPELRFYSPFILQHALQDLLLTSPSNRYSRFSKLLGTQLLDYFQDIFNSLATRYNPPNEVQTFFVDVEKLISDLSVEKFAQFLKAFRGSNLHKTIEFINELVLEYLQESNGRALDDDGKISSEVLDLLISYRKDEINAIFDKEISLQEISSEEQEYLETTQKSIVAYISQDVIDKYLDYAKLQAHAEYKKQADFFRIGLEIAKDSPDECPFCGTFLTGDISSHITKKHEEILNQISSFKDLDIRKEIFLEGLGKLKEKIENYYSILGGKTANLSEIDNKEDKAKILEIFGDENFSTYEQLIVIIESITKIRNELSQKKEETILAIQDIEGSFEKHNQTTKHLTQLGDAIITFISAGKELIQNISNKATPISQMFVIFKKQLNALAGTQQLSMTISILENFSKIKKYEQIKQAIDSMKELRAEVTTYVSDKTRAMVENQLTDEVMSWYRQIKTKGDPDVHFSGFSLSGNKARHEISVSAKSYGHDLVSAVSSLSESKLNALGLSIKISNNVKAGIPFGFLVIDDPVQSLDGDHAVQISTIICELVKDYGKQVILLSHNKNWLDQLIKGAQSINGIYYEMTGFNVLGPNLSIEEWKAWHRRLQDVKAICNNTSSTQIQLQQAEEEIRLAICDIASKVYYKKTGKMKSSHSLNETKIRNMLIESGIESGLVDRISQTFTTTDDSHHSGESYSANRERIRHYHSWVHELAKELN